MHVAKCLIFSDEGNIVNVNCSSLSKEGKDKLDVLPVFQRCIGTGLRFPCVGIRIDVYTALCYSIALLTLVEENKFCHKRLRSKTSTSEG